MRDMWQGLKGWAVRNPRAAFLASLALLVFLTVAFTSLLSGGRTAPPAQVAQKQEQKQPPPRPKEPWETVVVNGPVEARAFRQGENPQVTLGGELLLPHCGVAVVPKGYGWVEKGEPVAATVTWPLGGKYDRVRLKAGFLPSDAKWPGGTCQLFLDGRKVWEKRVTPETVAGGGAADVSLEFDCRGVNALTLRVSPTEIDRAWGEASVPYPAVVYDLEFVRGGGE